MRGLLSAYTQAHKVGGEEGKALLAASVRQVSEELKTLTSKQDLRSKGESSPHAPAAWYTMYTMKPMPGRLSASSAKFDWNVCAYNCSLTTPTPTPGLALLPGQSVTIGSLRAGSLDSMMSSLSKDMGLKGASAAAE